MGRSQLSTKRKICVVITTRGNYAKMKSVIEGITGRDDLELQLIVAGAAVLERHGTIAGAVAGMDNVRIDRAVHYIVEGENPIAMAKSAGLAVSDFASAFESLQPDVVIVIADRYETLAIGMAATYMNIPIAHVEGGEVSGSIDESVRHAVTKLAHLHFPATEDAAQRIIRLGETPESVKTVGATSLDVIAQLDLDDLGRLESLQRKSGVGPILNLLEPYLVIIQHPVTSEYADNLTHVNETVAAIDQLAMPTIWIWPNVDAGSDGISKGIRIYRETKNPKFLHLFKDLPIEYYAPLLRNAACLIGNSSSGIRESAFLGTPTVNIGTRQANRQRGPNVIDVDYDGTAIRAAIEKQINHGRYEPDFLYGDGKAGPRIVTHLAEFTFDLQKNITY
jgi:UDP-hydrolysing UDP-N-acetyl-D-glucosamine 2-epimerase